MDRREFLSSAAALALGVPLLDAMESGDVREMIDAMKHAERRSLLLLLDHNSYRVRQAATGELSDRGCREVRGLHKPLAWKKELTPEANVSGEVRKRLDNILLAIELEEAALLWSGRRMPALSGYTENQPVSLHRYTADVNRHIGGCLDAEPLSPRRLDAKNIPSMLSARGGELFWEWIERNRTSVRAYEKEGRVCLDDWTGWDDVLAHNGAFHGRLTYDKNGAVVWCMTDSGLELLQVAPLACTAGIFGDTAPVSFEPAATKNHPDALYVLFPEGIPLEMIDTLSMKIRATAMPLLHAGVTDFSRQTVLKMGGYTVTVHPLAEGIATNGKTAYLLKCRIRLTDESGRQGIPNTPKRFFTSYCEPEKGKPEIHPSVLAEYACIPGGAEFMLSHWHCPTRLDIRIPDERLVHEMERTLTFNVREKVQ